MHVLGCARHKEAPEKNQKVFETFISSFKKFSDSGTIHKNDLIFNKKTLVGKYTLKI